MAFSSGDHASGCEASQRGRNGEWQGQVPPGGSHHGTVPPSQRGETHGSGHCWGASEWGGGGGGVEEEEEGWHRVYSVVICESGHCT